MQPNKWTQMLMIAVLSIGVLTTACQKKDDGGGGGTPAATPAPAPAPSVTTLQCNVPGNTTCNPGIYQNNSWPVYPYQWNYYNGFCGCPANYRPVYNATWGIGCAPIGTFTTDTAYMGWMYQAQNNQWLNIPQVTYSATVSTSGNCFADAAQACDSGVANSCGANAECRKIGPASSLGLCVYRRGTDVYQQNYGCYYQGSAWVCPPGSGYYGGYNGGYNPYYGGGYYGGGYYRGGYYYGGGGYYYVPPR